MDDKLIKFEFYQFEKLFFENNSFDNDNFFVLLDNKDIDDLFCSFLTTNPLKSDKLDKMFKKDLEILISFLQLKKIDFKNFIYLKSELDVLSSYLLLFLIKTFSIKYKFKQRNNDTSLLSERELLFDRNDYINVFVDFLFKFFIFNEIKSKVFFIFSKDNLRKFVFRFIELCSKENLIKVRDVRLFKRSYKLLSFVLFPIPCVPHVAFYTNTFNHYIRSETEFYAYNLHFSSIVEITKRSKYSNAHFKIPTEQVSMLFERSLFIDRKFLERAFFLLLENQKLDKDVDLFKEIEILFKKIEKFTIEQDLDSLRYCHSKLSKLLTLIRINTVLSMKFDDIKIYLPFMFCFRGRIYELSDLSFTFYKEFRFCMYTGFYETEVENFHPISTHINFTLMKQFNLFEKFEWFLQLSEIRKYTCIWIFISIGALKKTELGSQIHISEFILKGLDMWKKKNHIDFNDIFDKIEFNYLINLINELIFVKEGLKKWIFWKDAPASCFQHQLLILGSRNDNSYKICNLDSIDTWYDPYSFLIKDFFEKNCNKITKNLYTNSGLMLSRSKYFQIFSRNRLKKVFMTESYGAGRKKLFFFFTLNLKLDDCSEDEKKAIMLIWEKFFEYISNDNPLFAQSSKAITNYFIENKIERIVNPDQTIVDYSCFEIEITQSEIYIEKKRHTLQNRNITTLRDERQFKTSIRANFVHTQDAILARKYILITKMWSIHDCFSIDFLNVTYMVSLLNELMNGEFYDLKINISNKKIIYSIFIVL